MACVAGQYIMWLCNCSFPSNLVQVREDPALHEAQSYDLGNDEGRSGSALLCQGVSQLDCWQHFPGSWERCADSPYDDCSRVTDHAAHSHDQQYK